MSVQVLSSIDVSSYRHSCRMVTEFQEREALRRAKREARERKAKG